jgi:hypothetical protein
MNRLAGIFAESCQEEVDQNGFDRTYDMIQKILSCKKMCKCHPFLYALDQEHVNEDDRKKVEELYECAVQRGFIKEDKPEGDEKGEIRKECDCEEDPYSDKLCGSPDDALTPLGVDNTPAA